MIYLPYMRTADGETASMRQLQPNIWKQPKEVLPLGAMAKEWVHLPTFKFLELLRESSFHSKNSKFACNFPMHVHIALWNCSADMK